MSPDDDVRSRRREFLGQLGGAALLAGTTGVGALGAQPPPSDAPEPATPPWDMSWVKLVTAARYRVVFDSTAIAGGAALELAADFILQFRLVYNTRVTETRAVIVMRQLGAQMAFGDALWEKYAIGEDAKVDDPATGTPARHNPFLHAEPDAKPDTVGGNLESLRANGAIFLVCNRAAMNAALRLAQKTGQDVEAVRADVRAGLVPGALLMPDGIFATIRAQNAGCAYMRGA
jgi:hypothetical protein